MSQFVKARRRTAGSVACAVIVLVSAWLWRGDLGVVFSRSSDQGPTGFSSAAPMVITDSRGDVAPVPTSAPQTLPATKGFINTLQMKFVGIEPGEFEMGTPPGEAGRNDEETLHHVKISKPFLMAATTVTQAQWSALIDENPSHFHGDRLPVERVPWNEAVDFCAKLSRKEGRHYRLPTEAEWEYACRAGTRTAFSFGDAERNLDDFGWYDADSGNTTHEVGTKKPNPWQLYDMHGSVWQWCSDWYGPYQGDATDPQGPKQADENSPRVLRGGSWDAGPQLCRSGSRVWFAPGHRCACTGFRVVLDAE